jgi:hypothetical protein
MHRPSLSRRFVNNPLEGHGVIGKTVRYGTEINEIQPAGRSLPCFRKTLRPGMKVKIKLNSDRRLKLRQLSIGIYEINLKKGEYVF